MTVSRMLGAVFLFRSDGEMKRDACSREITPERDGGSMNDPLIIAGRSFHSRLLMGTGKFASPQVMKKALEASGAEIVTVALRRVELENPEDSIMSVIDASKYLLLPNTSGA